MASSSVSSVDPSEQSSPRTFEGIESDLDDIRRDLRQSLPRYEKRISELMREGSERPELSELDLEGLFEVSLSGPWPSHTLGPRTVAVAAERVEKLLEQLVDRPDFSELESRFEKLYRRIRTTKQKVRNHNRQMQDGLEQILDSKLNEFEEQRDQKLETLDKQIGQGTLPPGKQARKHKADLWEQQRDKARAVRQYIEALEQHLDKGARIATEGLESLFDILSRLRQKAETGAAAGDRAVDSESSSVDSDQSENPSDPMRAGLDGPGPTQKLGANEREGRHGSGQSREPEAEMQQNLAHEASAETVAVGWIRVGHRRLAAGFGPPGVLIGGLIASQAGYLAGVEAISVPVLHWPYGPFILALSAAWLVLTPLFMGWEPRWCGWSLEWVCRGTKRRQVPLLAGAESLTIADWTVRWHKLTERDRAKWGSPEDSEYGWYISVATPTEGSVRFVAAADSATEWNDCDWSKLVDLPDRYWKVDEKTFYILRDKLHS